MQKYVEEAINLLNESFSERFDDFRGLYLHGLFTDGKDHKGEDIELVAVFDVENKFKRELIWPIVGKIETDLNVYLDLHPIAIDDLENDEEFYDEVVNHGIFFERK